MVASVATKSRRFFGQSRAPTESGRVRLLEWAVTVPTLALLGTLTVVHWPPVTNGLPAILVWPILVAIVDLLPVPFTDEVRVTMSLPLLMAAGMVLPPQDVGLIAFVASFDPRELRGQVSLARALFNRSTVALSSLTASFVFHTLGGDPLVLPAAAGFALLALAADQAINAPLVILAGALATRTRFRDALSEVVLGRPVEFIVTYSAFGMIAVSIAIAAATVGPWGIVVAVVPLVVTRQMFALRRRSAVTSARLLSKEQVLSRLSQRIADERRDERARVAADLHDEVLTALYKVHLIGEVLKQDLAQGRLLELEDDLPELREATRTASEALRDLIGDLRHSPVGSRGLCGTLRLLIDELSAQSTARIEDSLESVGGPALTQLLIYQVAREALQNAISHSHASSIAVRLFDDGAVARLIVMDDGVGFWVRDVDRTGHFGLQIMAERVQLAGGTLSIDSRPGTGTKITARFPLEPDHPPGVNPG